MAVAKRIDAFLVVALVVSLLMVVGVLTFAGPCIHDDGSTSACFTASRAILFEGILACVASVVGLVVGSAGKANVRAFCAFLAACAGVVATFTPGTLFGLCMMQTMRCWTVMRPFALACGVVIAVCGVVAAIRALRAKAR